MCVSPLSGLFYLCLNFNQRGVDQHRCLNMLANSVTYSDELFALICERIADGESLRKICADEDMPSVASFMRWLGDEKNEALREQYARARERQADFYAEEIIQIADDGSNDTYKDEDGNVRTDQDVIGRSRLRVDARKWYASKLAPKKYGDKIEVDNTIKGKIEHDVNLRPQLTKEEWLAAHGLGQVGEG